MLVVSSCPETIANVLHDLPVGAASLQWLEHLIKPLDSSLGARERAFFFQAGAGWQYHVGIPAGVAEEDFLHHEEIEFGERIADIVSVLIH